MHIPFLTVFRHLLSFRPTENVWHQPSIVDQPFATVVFVHGLFGHAADTWKPLLELVATDPRIPGVEVVSWGWTTGALVGRNSISVEGRRLRDDLQLRINQGRPIILVGHSMGGLAIFDALTAAMKQGQAQSHPLSGIESIVVYATPTNGAQAAGLVGIPLRLLGLASKQIQELARGSYTDGLVREVVNRIYRPSGLSGSLNYERKIPIHAVLGANDRVVAPSAAQSVFADPTPVVVKGSHSSCKAPDDHADPRYLVLQHVILPAFDRWFRALCREAIQGATRSKQDAARLEIEEKCRPLFVRSLTVHQRLFFTSRSEQDRERILRQFADVVVQACSDLNEVSVDVAIGKGLWFIEGFTP